MSDERATPDAGLATLAARQHGVVTRGQLVELGLDKDQISYRVRVGRLHRIHRSVYAVGHSRLGNEGSWLAAVLAIGEGAALSHRSAAELWRLLLPSRGEVDVTTPGRGGRNERPGLRVHRSTTLTRGDVVRLDGIQVTTVARTLVDLRRLASPAEFRQAVRQAEVRGFRLGGVEVDGTRSELEYLFLRLCSSHRLPVPEANVRVGPYLVDFLWRQARVVVETDGRRFHRGAHASQSDRRRDVELRRRGFAVHRFSYLQVTQDRAAVAAEVRRALAGWREGRTMSD